MYLPPRGFFSNITEGTLLIVITIFLLRLGVLMLKDIWVWLLVIAAIILFARAGWRFYKYYKDTHGY